jgi:hypothetical protein
VPAGFSSSEQNPTVTPQQTTSYLLTVNDNFNSASGSVTVQVNPAPVINLGPPDTMVCIYNTITLDAGNAGASYYWSNGATTQDILVETTGITYDVQNYWVKVINNFACMDSAAIQVIFTFAACTGIDESAEGGRIRVYPNPTGGTLTLSLEDPSGSVKISVLSVPGEVVFSEEVRTSGTLFEKRYDLSFLPVGLYFIRIEAEPLSGTVKFIKR